MTEVTGNKQAGNFCCYFQEGEIIRICDGKIKRRRRYFCAAGSYKIQQRIHIRRVKAKF